VLAGVFRVDGLTVVENGDVGVEQHGVIEVLHDSPVLFEYGVFLFLFVLLHVLGHLLETGHLLPS
jgi:hypothetical protein